MAESENKYGNEEDSIGKSLFKAILLNVGIIIAIFVIFQILARSMGEGALFLLIILIAGGLPALAIFNFIFGKIKSSKNKSLAKAMYILGVTELIIYGACWGIIGLGSIF